MKYTGILFDMDGTVLDTLDDIADSLNHSLAHFGLRAVDRERVRASLGNGARRLVESCVDPDCSPELLEQLLSWYMHWYEQHCNIKTCAFEGIVPLMARLRERGCKIAIISNKPHDAVKELADRFFPGLLELAVGESSRVRRKPDPSGVLAAADSMGIELSRCLYIGDSEVDVETAKRANMDCIAVSWGFRSREQLAAAGAQRIVDTVQELEEAILTAE